MYPLLGQGGELYKRSTASTGRGAVVSSADHLVRVPAQSGSHKGRLLGLGTSIYHHTVGNAVAEERGSTR
jgi:hypothetical protein